jgi:hypothetical protein
LGPDVVVISGAYLLAVLITAIDVKFLKGEHELSYGVNGIRAGYGDIDVAFVMVMKDGGAGYKSPTAVIVAVVITKTGDVFHVAQDHGSSGTVGMDIVIVAGCIELYEDGRRREPIISRAGLGHGATLFVGVRG